MVYPNPEDAQGEIAFKLPQTSTKNLAMLSNAADELETEKEHSDFLERLLKALYGSGWEYLTISKANEIRKSLGGPE